MDAFFATIPTHFLYIYQMIKQNNIKNCDLYYTNVTKDAKEIAENVRKLGIFKKVYLLPNISIEYPITAKRCIDIALKKNEVKKLLQDKKYDNVYYNVDGWLYNSIIYSGLKRKGVKFRNIFVENGVNPYITSYDNKKWYLRLFIHANFLTCMDGKFIDERYLFEPDAVQVKQSGAIKTISKIDMEDKKYIYAVNNTFNYDADRDSYNGKDIIIMEQAPRQKPINMIKVWENVSNFINKKRAIVKSHPRQCDSELYKIGIDIYDRYTIPWEALMLNENISAKTLICIFSTACITPKLMFDAEPRVIMLFKIMGRDYSFFGDGMLKFIQSIGAKYKDKSKFFIPNSWEEFGAYCRKYGLCN